MGETLEMKRLIAGLFATTLVLSPYAFAADQVTSDAPKAETKTEQTKEYVKDKTQKAKAKTKRAAKKTKQKTKEVIDNRKTTDPASPSESKPEAPKSK